MGYETKMIVVEKHFTMKDRTALIGNDVFSVYNKDHQDPKSPLIYYPDGNTETKVPAKAPIKEGPYCFFLSMFDLCKVDQMPGICDFKDSDGCSVRKPLNGDDLIGLDPYGAYRSFVPIQEVIDLMETQNRNEPYRRYTVALALLKSIQVEFPNNDLREVGCLFYGH